MDDKPGDTNKTDVNKFEQLSQEADRGLLLEFWDFLRYNKKWWLTPIVVVLLLMGILVWISGTSVAPFLYTFW
jgi:hypothetical protein